jgi:hypothetical protein
MKKRIVVSGLFLILFSMFITDSYSQIVSGLNLHGTANAVWDSVRSRYLYTYQEEGVGSVIYQCDRKGANVSIYTDQSGKFLFPSGMVIVGNYLYVADMIRIWKLNLADGSFADTLKAPGWKGLIDIAWDKANTLYVSECFDSKIYKVDINTKAYDTVAVDTNGIKNPTGLYYESTPKKRLYIVSFKANSPVTCYDVTGDSTFMIMPTTYQYCYSITGDGRGNYFLTDWKSTTANAGKVYKFIGGFGTSVPFVQNLNFPADVFVKPSPNGLASGDTLVVPELRSGKNTLMLVKADRDLVPPTADSAKATSATTVVVYFSEPVSSSATVKLNYTGLGVINTITLGAGSTQATLTLATPMVINIQQTLNVQNVKDLAGNVMTQGKTFYFRYKPVSIYDAYLKNGLSVSPNPVQNKFIISYNLLQSAHVNIELYDIMGNQVAVYYNGTQQPDEYKLSCQIPDRMSKNGVYILKSTVDGQIFMSKILLDR